MSIIVTLFIALVSLVAGGAAGTWVGLYLLTVTSPPKPARQPDFEAHLPRKDPRDAHHRHLLGWP